MALARVAFIFLIAFCPIAHSKTVLVLGDSISAGYGMDVEQGWVNLLAQKLENTDHKVINASISGDTTAMGLGRLPRLLEKHQPDIVLIELGGNDGLRGFPIRTMRKNFQRMIEMSQQAGATVVLAAIQIPPNYGSRYTSEFFNLYTELQTQYELALVPFILQDIAEYSELMQRDGIHPTAEAQSIILRNVWPHLAPVLEGS